MILLRLLSMSYFKMINQGFGKEVQKKQNAQLSYRISRFNFLLFYYLG